MTVLETDRLADLIRAKLDCLVRLREMGRRQLELIDGGNMTGLLDLLAAKQRALMDLQGIEQGLDPFRHDDPERRPWRAVADRRRCAEQATQCEGLLADIVAQERSSERLLVARRDETARRLQGAHQASQARGAYLADTPSGGCQLDLQTD